MVRTHYSIPFTLVLFIASPACFGVDKEWNLAANGTWSSAVNWSPNGVPTASDTVFLGRAPFPQGFLTTLDTNATVAGFTMRNGSDFATSGNQLIVNGLTTVAGTGSFFTINSRSAGDLDGLDTGGLLIDNNGQVSLEGGILELESGDLDILTGGVAGSGGLGGYGTVELIESGLAGGQVFNNSGRLFVGKSIFATGGILTLTNTDTDSPVTIGDGSVDLDGDSETGIVDVDDDPFGQISNLTLVVDAELSDSFSGEMQIGRGDTIDMRRAWTLGNGDLQLNGANGTATLRGATMTVTGNSIINVGSGTGAIESNVTLNGGTMNVASGTTLRLDGTANINVASAVELNGTAMLEVTGTTMITDHGGDFDWDGGGEASTRVTGLLALNVDHVDVADDTFNGTIDLDDNGDLVVNVGDGEWTLGQGADLSKNNAGLSTVSGSQMSVDQGSVIARAGTLEINADTDFGTAADLVVDPGATVRMDGQNTFRSGALLLINGTLDLNGATEWGGPALVSGNGTIINDGGATVTGDTTIFVDQVDWDPGSTVIEAGSSLTLNVDTLDLGNDTFNNTFTVHSGILDVNVADDSWTLGTSGLVTLANTSGTKPELNGDRVVLSSGGTIHATGGDAEVNAPVTVNTGSEILIQSPLTLQLHGPTTLNGGSINEAGGVQATVGQFGAVTVTGDSSVNVHTYNWDQAPTTIESGGKLTVNVTALDLQPGERYDHDLTLNSGDLTVNNAANEWTIDDQLSLNNTSGTAPNIFGATLNVGDGVGTFDADVTVGGTGPSEFETTVNYYSDADVAVSAGAILRHNRPVFFRGGGEFTGSGTLDFASAVDVMGATTIDMPGGTVDMDGPALDILGNTVSVDAPWTLNVAALASFGKTNISGKNVLDIDGTAGGTLTVNLTDLSASWQVNPSGEVNLTSNNTAATLLAGSDINLDGELNVTGDVRTTARMSIGGTVNIGTAGQPLRLEGGTLASPNRLDGGTIHAPGLLMTNAGHALHGFGSITADVDFGGNAELKATNGELVVSGSVVDVGEIGTSDVDGILNMTNAWNTNVADQVRLAGGELRGATITNDGTNGIRGHGQITARVVNHSGIFADGGVVVLDNSATDYDGAGGGLLSAADGDLELRDDATFGFGGTARVGSGREAFVNGFRMNFNSASTLEMNGGTWRSTQGMNMAGTLTVNAGSASEMRVANDLVFANGSNTTLLGNLRIQAEPAIVEVGANLTGGGDLVIDSAGRLILSDGALVGVGLRNDGKLELGTGTARADAADLIQTANGTLDIQLAGTALPQFDRLLLSGGAQLDGTLSVSLRGGFVPSLGETFSILTANGGVSGTFIAEDLPILGGGLLLDVVYDVNSVVLQVIQSLSPDFDGDGDVDGADVDLLVMEIAGMTNRPLFDLTGDGVVNGGDLTDWLAQAGALNLPSGNPYLLGDANLDGSVDVSDFGAWNSHKFTADARWTAGDFNADGFVDVSDFGIWNANKFSTADRSALVPEPSGCLSCLAGLLLLAGRKWRILGP